MPIPISISSGPSSNVGLPAAGRIVGERPTPIDRVLATAARATASHDADMALDRRIGARDRASVLRDRFQHRWMSGKNPIERFVDEGIGVIDDFLHFAGNSSGEVRANKEQ